MKKITVGEYLRLPISQQIEYSSVLSHQASKELLKLNYSTLTYKEVKTCFKELKKDNPDIMKLFFICFDIDEKDFLSIPIHNYFQIKKYIEEKFIFLYEREIELLKSVDANAGMWDIAGGSELDEFYYELPLSQLGKVYGQYPYDLAEKSYLEIIRLLRMNNKQSRVESEYSKLMSKK
jgi:hypothetical protein